LSSAEHIFTSNGLLTRQGSLEANPQRIRRPSHCAAREGQR
jgi:hypothetical protein